MRHHRLALIAALSVTALLGIAWAQDQNIQAVIGNVFLQNTSPGTAQIGHANLTGTFRAGQVFVQQGSFATIPVVGNNTHPTGTTVGGSFSVASSQDAIALRATGTAGTGNAIGVKAVSRGVFGTGVLAEGTTGIKAEATGTGAVVSSSPYAGLFINKLAGNRARGLVVRTENGASSADFQNSSSTSDGVLIRNVSGDNPKPALVVTTNAGTGIDAQTREETQIAVLGRNFGVSGSAIGGYFLTSSPDGVGLRGEAKNTGTGFGVYGFCQAPNGYGVFSTGNTGASGTKSFLIDHPADPENRYLRHYSAEGDVPRNVYQGTVATGADGYAWVRLPDYYESINRDGLVQLTVVDSSNDFVMAKVTHDISSGKFQLRTSKPGVRVNWRVEATRNDRWVQHSQIDPEPLKPRQFRGTYLAPELYGKPDTEGQWNAQRRNEGTSRP